MQCMSASQRGRAPRSWAVATAGHHAAPPSSSVSEFYGPPVMGTALPSSRSSGSSVGQLVLLLPQPRLLFEEVTNY